MSRIFVSHASEDKATRVRPLVEALLHEQFLLWVDRPGMGVNNLGLTSEVIVRHDIRGIVAGCPWDEQILDAHRQCGAVLACMSKSLASDRQVLVHELALARYANKLVTCIVDDLPFDHIPQDLGLAIPARTQAPRLDTELLGRATRRLRTHPEAGMACLASAELEQWEIFLRLAADLRTVLRRQGSISVSEEELAQARATLREFPHAPMVRFQEIPQALIDLLAQRMDTPAAARAHFRMAMQLAFDSRDAADTEKQVVVFAAEVIRPEQAPSLDYWTQVTAIASIKSRRTLAALFLVPQALDLNQLPTSISRQLTRFLSWLRDPGNTAGPF